MPHFIEGLTDIQENCGAVFAVVEGPEDCVSYAVALLDGMLVMGESVWVSYSPQSGIL